MPGERPTFPDGKRYIVGQRRELAGGQVELELVVPSGRRRRVVVPAEHENEGTLDEIAAAIVYDDRVIKGRRVGGG